MRSMSAIRREHSTLVPIALNGLPLDPSTIGKKASSTFASLSYVLNFLSHSLAFIRIDLYITSKTPNHFTMHSPTMRRRLSLTTPEPSFLSTIPHLSSPSCLHVPDFFPRFDVCLMVSHGSPLTPCPFFWDLWTKVRTRNR